MADDKMMAQMTAKGGFIAALDQSGGSTPGALRLYGIPDTAYSGEAEMFRLMHEMRVRIMTAPAFTGDKVIGAILFEGTMDGEVQRQADAGVSVGRARRRAVCQSRQGARSRKGRRQLMRPMPRLDRSADARGQARRLRHQDALGDQSCFERRNRRDRRAAVRGGGADRRARADADPRTGSLDQEPRQEGRGGDPARRIDKSGLDALPAGRKVMLKLTIPDVPDLYPAADRPPARRPGRGALRRLYARRRLQASRRQSRHDRELLAGPGRGSQAFDERRRVQRRTRQAIDEIYNASTVKA